MRSLHSGHGRLLPARCAGLGGLAEGGYRYPVCEDEREADHSPFDDAVSDLLNAIKAEQKKIVDTPMSCDIALALLPA